MFLLAIRSYTKYNVPSKKKEKKKGKKGEELSSYIRNTGRICQNLKDTQEINKPMPRNVPFLRYGI